MRDEDYLGSVAFDLHSFYQGVERIFEAFAKSIDRKVPRGETWHKNLLVQMTEEVPKIRPAVISEETRAALDSYRTFRHLARNIYTFNLDAGRIKTLVENLPDTVEKACNDISVFLDFLKKWGTYKEEYRKEEPTPQKPNKVNKLNKPDKLNKPNEHEKL